MEKLTKAQRKQVIEYFATQCAEGMPAEEVDQEDHLRFWRIKAQRALVKDLADVDWDSLVFNLVDVQTLDRDPGGYLNSIGEPDTEANRDSWTDYHNDMAGAFIDRLAE